MEEQLVSQEVLDAMNAPPAPPPKTPNTLIWEKAQAENDQAAEEGCPTS